MALPTGEQYLRALALENATRYAASRSRHWEAYEVVDLAEYFADYIRNGKQEDEDTNA